MLISLDEDEILTQQIIELIDQFSLSIAFFQWLAGDDVVKEISFERVGEDKFERLGHYFIDGLLVFIGRVQFFLNHIEETFKERIYQNCQDYYPLLLELQKMEKRRLSNVLRLPSYTIFSEFYNRSNLCCGDCWEVYDICNLVKVYKVRKNSLRPPQIQKKAFF